MKPWKKILCAVDGSDASLHSAESARLIAKKLGAELVHLYVIPTNLEVLPGPPLQPEIRQGLHESAEETLGQLIRLAERESIPVQSHIVDGDPAAAIIDAAARTNSDLIVVSARGATRVERWLLGSNTTKILQHAPVPVLVTRGTGPAQPFSKILCGIDGSAESEHAARAAMLLTKAHGAELRLCHVTQVSKETVVDLPDRERFEQEKIVDWVNDIITGLCTEADQQGAACQRVTSIGNPIDELLKVAEDWQADLITVGSRGLGGFSRMTLGSTSARITEHAQCSVLVTKRPG